MGCAIYSCSEGQYPGDRCTGPASCQSRLVSQESAAEGFSILPTLSVTTYGKREATGSIHLTPPSRAQWFRVQVTLPLHGESRLRSMRRNLACHSPREPA